MYKIFATLFITSFLFSCGIKDNSNNPIPEEIVEEGPDESWEGTEILEEEIYNPAPYQATETVYTDLIHTKLAVDFNWEESRMNGVATITAKPHFYPSDSIILDAKGMDILYVKKDGTDLKYTYTDDLLRIKLGKTYTRNDKYTIEIKYVAKPEERKTTDGVAIASDKGLYFINPKKEDDQKMPQIWTQGETEASSVWFPTIDAPNVKTSQEILMTVNDKYLTLSNGKLIASKKNADGTRTDHWKQDLPHAPYLFMMGVGEFVKVKDQVVLKSGRKLDVNYYVEKEWEPYAKDIFGETPKMITFFSNLLDLEYPWDKYDQIVVRDYVSGAMENTGAVIFGDYVYKNKRELLDENDQSTIAHELFHHWFGDLVTAESWANLTLNESFANYSQYLWDEHRYGANEAEYQAENEEEGYYQSSQLGGYHELAWFHYNNQDQMFDGHSYNKGGRILHMLRNYVGDEAFFASITKYLKDNKFKAAEYHHLRLAFEEVTGEDLNWFFKQWYESKGHPVMNVTQRIDEDNLKVTLTIEQVQNLDEFALYKLPVDVAVHDANGKIVHRVWIDEVTEEIELPYSGEIRAVVFDENKMLLGKVNEEKTAKQYIYQFYNSSRYETRAQSLEEGIESGDAFSDQMILDGLNDEFWKIREIAIQKVNFISEAKKAIAITILKNLMMNDPKSQVRSVAASFLTTNTEDQAITAMLKESIAKDQSYMVVGNSLRQLVKLDAPAALVSAKALENENSSKLLASVAQVYSTSGTEENAAFFNNLLTKRQLGIYDQLSAMNSFTIFNSRMPEDQIKSALTVYRHLDRKGGYYAKMFSEQSIDYLIETLDGRKAELEEQKTNEKDVLKLAEIQSKLSKIDLVIAEYKSFLKER